MNLPSLFRNQALPCAITLSLLAAGSASAATVTWDGGGGAAISWTNGANWNPSNIAPTPSLDALRFQGTSVANNNDFPAGTIFQKIDFRATTTTGNAAFDLVGNSVTLDAGSPITTSVITVGTLTDKISFDLSLSSGSPIITTGTAHNLNIAGVISGAANSLTKAGAATLTLSGVNSFSGKTVVSAGTLELTEARALQNSPLDTATSVLGNPTDGLKVTTSTLTLGGLEGTGTNNPGKALASVFTTTSGGYDALTELTLNIRAAAKSSYSQVIANGAAAGMSLIKTGAGTQIFGIAAAHTYSGGTTLSAGTLQIGSSSAGTVGAVTSGPLGTGTAVLNGGALSSSGTNAQTLLNAATIGGNVTLGDAVDNGTLTFSAGVDLGAADRTLTTASSVAFNGAVSGNGGITKAGSATLTLSGANTYSGTTTVSVGTLSVNGSTAGGAVSVSSGATLAGSGTVGGATTINSGAFHSPGNSPGVQTFNSGLTYSNGSTFVWELTGNTNSGRGTAFDGVNVSGGTLTINGGVTNNLVFNGVGSTVNWSDAFWASNQQWLVFDNASQPTLVSSNVFDTINVGFDSISQSLTSVRSGSSFSWDTIGDELYLTYAVPEPSTYALLALLGAGFAGRALVRRRRRHGVD